MITTVVTSTVTTVTAITDFGIVVGLVAVIALVAFLCAKELAGVSKNRSGRTLANFLDVGIVPLIIAFAMIVIVTVMEILA